MSRTRFDIPYLQLPLDHICRNALVMTPTYSLFVLFSFFSGHECYEFHCELRILVTLKRRNSSFLSKLGSRKHILQMERNCLELYWRFNHQKQASSPTTVIKRHCSIWTPSVARHNHVRQRKSRVLPQSPVGQDWLILDLLFPSFVASFDLVNLYKEEDVVRVSLD